MNHIRNQAPVGGAPLREHSQQGGPAASIGRRIWRHFEACLDKESLHHAQAALRFLQMVKLQEKNEKRSKGKKVPDEKLRFQPGISACKSLLTLRK